MSTMQSMFMSPDGLSATFVTAGSAATTCCSCTQIASSVSLPPLSPNAQHSAPPLRWRPAFRTPRQRRHPCHIRAVAARHVSSSWGGTPKEVGACQTLEHTLSCGLHLEVLHQAPVQRHSAPRQQQHQLPPVLFLHGAMHGAWCWQEHFMPYFSAHGVESFALSLRGHSGSDPLQDNTCSMADQLSDISSFVRGLPQAPVLVGHSIGGIIAQRYLARLSQEGSTQLAPIAGAALLANAGPREFMPKLRWFQSQRSLWHAARVFLWMLKRPVHDGRLVREMFFSRDLPEQDFRRYHQHLAAAPQLVPITREDMQQPVLLGPHTLPPVVAIGGADDGIVMEYQLRDAADFFGARAVVVPGVAHDLMLDTRWEQAASILLEWVLATSKASKKQDGVGAGA